MGLKRRLEGYSCHAPRIVRDRRRSDDGDDLEREVLAEAGGDERIDVPVVEPAALLDQGSRQQRKRGVLQVLRQTPLANGPSVRDRASPDRGPRPAASFESPV
jgi:hypothetical protein